MESKSGSGPPPAYDTAVPSAAQPAGQPVFMQAPAGQPVPGGQQIVYMQGGGGQPIYIQPGPGQMQQPGVIVVQAQPQPQVKYYYEDAVRTTCPSCQEEVLTSLEYQAGSQSFVMGTIIGTTMFGLLGCCLIPCFIQRCQDVVHKCPRCEHTIAKFDRRMDGHARYMRQMMGTE